LFRNLTPPKKESPGETKKNPTRSGERGIVPGDATRIWKPLDQVFINFRYNLENKCKIHKSRISPNWKPITKNQAVQMFFSPRKQDLSSYMTNGSVIFDICGISFLGIYQIPPFINSNDIQWLSPCMTYRSRIMRSPEITNWMTNDFHWSHVFQWPKRSMIILFSPTRFIILINFRSIEAAWLEMEHIKKVSKTKVAFFSNQNFHFQKHSSKFDWKNKKCIGDH
jgi:hypothetical protein